MSLSFGIEMLRDKNSDDYKKKLAVLNACNRAGVSLPDEINDYFDGGGDPEYPLVIDFFNTNEYSDDYRQGIELDVSDIPEGVKIIRFFIGR